MSLTLDMIKNNFAGDNKMNKLTLIILLTLICGCNKSTNTDYIQETKQRDFETNPSSFNISRIALVCVEDNNHYCTKWVIQPK